jgi:hypothetical protein
VKWVQKIKEEKVGWRSFGRTEVIVMTTHIKCKCLGRIEELSWTLMMCDKMNQKDHGDSASCPAAV